MPGQRWRRQARAPRSRSVLATDSDIGARICGLTRSLSFPWRTSLLDRWPRSTGIAGDRSRRQEILGAHIVAYGPHAAIRPLIEFFHFVPREGPRAQAAEDGDLAARLVDAAITVETLGQCQRGARGIAPGDELGFRLGRKTVELGLAVGRRELHHLEAIDAVGDIRKERGVGRSDDDVARVGQLAIGIEFRDQLRQLRSLA